MTGASDREEVGAGRGRWGRVLRRRSQALDSFAVAGRNPQLRLVLIARLATVTGRWASAVALAVYAYGAGGATYVGLLAVVRIVPSALAGGLAAALLDRVRTDRLLLAAGLARVFAIGAAGVAALSGGHVVAVFGLVALESLLSTMARPLQTAALPFLARVPRELTASNLALTTIESAGMLIGPVVGGLLLAVWNAGGVLLVTAATYLVSAILIARIPSWQRTRPPATGPAKPTIGTIEGIRAIHADKRLRLLVGLYCVENVVTGSLNVLVVIAALDLLHLGSSGVGELNAAIGIGGLLGAIAGAALVGRRRMASGFGLGLVLCGFPLILIGVAPSVVPTILLLAILGIGVTIVDFSAVTLLQRAIHEDALAKVFSVLQSCFVVSIGLGAALAPVLVAWIGIRGALLASGAVLPVLVVLLWSRLVPLDTSEVLSDEIVNLLRSLPIFAPLELPALERLARAASSVAVRAGETVIAEGEQGDRYYAIRDGEFDVFVAGALASQLGRGEGFGEIALLRDVPRTATVTARTDARLYALERELFLEAVSQSPPSADAAENVIDMRLGSLRAGLATV
ncbi:MAG TPA: MFS transporter [Gaiellaceae bacterium]|nr:MFS transporter [Gaiellaceae bacterium]